jgi:hypothetical protein
MILPRSSDGAYPARAEILWRNLVGTGSFVSLQEFRTAFAVVLSYCPPLSRRRIFFFEVTGKGARKRRPQTAMDELEKTDMPTLLPPLYEGHAPIILHQAFHDALEAYDGWTADAPEPSVDFEGTPVLISAVFGRMRTCTDILPIRTLDAVRDIVGVSALELSEEQVTYAHAALLLRALCVERLRR